MYIYEWEQQNSLLWLEIEQFSSIKNVLNTLFVVHCLAIGLVDELILQMFVYTLKNVCFGVFIEL